MPPSGDDIITPSGDVDSSSGGEFEPLEFSLDEPGSLYQSIGSNIYKHSYENGRRYHFFRNGKYPIPNDDLEQNREDLKHVLVQELTGGTLVHAPIGDSPQKIIDLGTGTGSWAIEAGDRYPSAEVVGVDLSPIQPVWVPPNVKFIIDDVEDEWLTSAGTYDYAHLRNLMPFVKKVPQFLARCYENLRPGGWIESCDFDGTAHCDDGSMPGDWPLSRFWTRLAEALKRLGHHDVQIAPHLGAALTAAGFVRVSCVRAYKVPVGTWPADPTLRLIGLYMRQVVEDFLDAAAAKPYRALGMSEAEVAGFMDAVHASLRARTVHSYCKYYVWVAQKPYDG
ncbi:hypothetical protein SPI_04728 [Niveomyces insectorum RCEF 264]|uniref:Uncharacterized protein n=1 Tax=Niveomyces insectorum RCEF 264 TaxID=1081102 RepID=A0A167USQ9_9HYPO|nr:hypothetical protein SPI_04728 [Niveomyces insectorum RCEF 264]